MRHEGRWAYSDRLRPRMKALKAGAEGIVYLVPGATSGRRGLVARVRLAGAAERREAGSGFHHDFPWSLPFELLAESVAPVDLKPLVPDLASFRNKTAWGAYLQGRAAFQLTDADYRLLLPLLPSVPRA